MLPTTLTSLPLNSIAVPDPDANPPSLKVKSAKVAPPVKDNFGAKNVPSDKSPATFALATKKIKLSVEITALPPTTFIPPLRGDFVIPVSPPGKTRLPVNPLLTKPNDT